MKSNKSLSQNSTPTICLALLVRDEASVLPRCLNSVRPYIDRWCVVDTGSTDNSAEIIGQLMDDIPGNQHTRLFTDFARLRNELYSLASQHAEFVLMLDADEELLCLGDKLLPEESFDFARLEIMNTGHSIRQPRLFRSGLDIVYSGAVHEQVLIGDCHKHLDLPTVAIRHHGDGYRSRQANTPENDIAHLEASIKRTSQPVTELALARLLLTTGATDQARTRLEAITLDQHAPDETRWMAAYLLGHIYKHAGQTDAALEALVQAHELDPERAEALYHLAELLGTQARWQDAYDLTQLAIDLPIPDADYFEPEIYSWWAKLLHASYCIELERYREAHDTMQRIPAGRLNGKALEYRNELRRRPGMRQVSAGKAQKTDAGKTVPKLSIAMATYDDFDGVYFTIASILSGHPEVLDQVEILVLDNNPSGKYAKALRNLCSKIDITRYIADEQIRGTAIRTQLFNYARGAGVLCIDCHVVILPGALQGLINYFDQNPDCDDLLQGPMLSDNLDSALTHMEVKWHGGMFGYWTQIPQGLEMPDEPFEIQIQGMGLFACRRETWPGFNPRFVGFGGEEGYIQEKFRQRGGRTLCLPYLRWMHRFARPSGIPYAQKWEDWIRNYLIGFDELGLDTQELEQHYADFIGFDVMARARAAYEREKQNPFYFFDAIYCINLDADTERWQSVVRQAEILGFANRLRRFPAIETPDNHHVGCALSHRGILETAYKQGFENVLILEDDVLFSQDSLKILKNGLRELAAQDWEILYLGAHTWDRDYALADACQFLRQVGLNDPAEPGPTCTHAIAYHRNCFERILKALPETPDNLEKFLKDTLPAIDQMLAFDRNLERFLVTPQIATQPPLLKRASPDFRPMLTSTA